MYSNWQWGHLDLGPTECASHNAWRPQCATTTTKAVNVSINTCAKHTIQNLQINHSCSCSTNSFCMQNHPTTGQSPGVPSTLLHLQWPWPCQLYHGNQHIIIPTEHLIKKMWCSRPSHHECGLSWLGSWMCIVKSGLSLTFIPVLYHF